MVVPGIPDPTFAQLVYDCFQGSLMLVVSFSKKLDGECLLINTVYT